jgi:large subunit ribosomal protein L15
MRLNTLKPAAGSKKKAKRLGRGIGSGKGKTCGCGHKGQTARSGYSKKSGFEGGQAPMQRRLPKFGFKSMHVAANAEIRLHELNKFDSGSIIDAKALRDVNLIGSKVRKIKVILSGELKKAVTLKGLKVTSGARKVIDKVGGKIE